jgi:hypothetical protein
MITNVHDNSIVAFHDTENDREKRKQAVLLVFRGAWPQGMTDRQVMESLGFKDPNAARPRITELTLSGHIAEIGKVRDQLTGRSVRVSRAVMKEEQLKFA